MASIPYKSPLPVKQKMYRKLVGLRAFSARQYLLPVGAEADVVELFRSGTLLTPAESTDENRIDDLADGIGQWMLHNLSAEGALPVLLKPWHRVDG